MDGELTRDQVAFREEVRAFLDEKFDAQMRAWAARQAGVFAEGDLGKRWHRALYERGWAATSWPQEYGGPGWAGWQQTIFQDECARVGTPTIAGMGLSLCGPVIMRYGTPEQKAFFLPKMLSGEHYWCQGYSEPQSGSDLASLQTRAVRDGDDYVVNGSKIWTTHAHYSNWMFLLVRTSTEGKPQAGISFLVTPIDAPGITVRPIISMSGEHEVNQVFFDNVRIPVANRMGAENDGWTVAKYLLEHERGGSTGAVGMRFAIDRVKAIASEEFSDGGVALMNDPLFRRKLAKLEVEVMAVDCLGRASSSGSRSAAESVGASTASMRKLVSSQLGQKINELAVEALGPYAQADQRDALGMGANEPPIGPDYGVAVTARYLNNRASTIFGGSAEVQHNILARGALGL